MHADLARPAVELGKARPVFLTSQCGLVPRRVHQSTIVEVRSSRPRPGDAYDRHISLFRLRTLRDARRCALMRAVDCRIYCNSEAVVPTVNRSTAGRCHDSQTFDMAHNTSTIANYRVVNLMQHCDRLNFCAVD